jgi:DNA-binding XRE family transcriptional regulator
MKKVYKPEDPTKSDFCNLVRKIRRENRMTQVDFAASCNIARETVTYWELDHNTKDPSIRTVASFIAHCNLPWEVCSLFANDSPKPGFGPTPKHRNYAPSKERIYWLVKQVDTVLDEFFPEEDWKGCGDCLTGKCKHNAETQFARMMREAIYRFSRRKGWRLSVE